MTLSKLENNDELSLVEYNTYRWYTNYFELLKTPILIGVENQFFIKKDIPDVIYLGK